LRLARPAPVTAGFFLFTLDSNEPVCNSARYDRPPRGQLLRRRWRTRGPRYARVQGGVTFYQVAAPVPKLRPFSQSSFELHWGETGGTLGVTDKEIWVRMGK
jgi:hypothetical protein